ncbi:hypothetical protein AEQ27_02515 [Frigoribacterium sp. RIT-PI-h]|nr:hypothetical protein AEQ27_02515 [Frigoribacterium sp. RIT-PI-h]
MRRSRRGATRFSRRRPADPSPTGPHRARSRVSSRHVVTSRRRAPGGLRVSRRRSSGAPVPGPAHLEA